jgi:hypothetical protein
VPTIGSGGFIIEEVEDKNGLFPVFTVKTYTPPQAYQAKETFQYSQLGEIELNAQGQVAVVKSPVTGVQRQCDVHITYTRTVLDDEGPEVLKKAPVFREGLLFPDGSASITNSVWNGYKCPSGGSYSPSGFVEVEGLTVQQLKTELTPSEHDGVAGTVLVRSREYYRKADITIYRNTKVTATPY